MHGSTYDFQLPLVLHLGIFLHAKLPPIVSNNAIFLLSRLLDVALHDILRQLYIYSRPNDNLYMEVLELLMETESQKE